LHTGEPGFDGIPAKGRPFRRRVELRTLLSRSRRYSPASQVGEPVEQILAGLIRLSGGGGQRRAVNSPFLPMEASTR
jgi:hypothetical protein